MCMQWSIWENFINLHVEEILLKFSKMCTKLSIYENFYMFLNENTIHKNYTHISKNTSVVNPPSLPPKRNFFLALRAGNV